MKNNIGLFLAKRAMLNPEREAYVDGNHGERLTYAQLNARANRFANALIADGVAKGERVGRSGRSARWSYRSTGGSSPTSSSSF
jgi:acyl-CoA synthetase (AMP-forming)/AMP-acid ligase II